MFPREDKCLQMVRERNCWCICVYCLLLCECLCCYPRYLINSFNWVWPKNWGVANAFLPYTSKWFKPIIEVSISYSCFHPYPCIFAICCFCALHDSTCSWNSWYDALLGFLWFITALSVWECHICLLSWVHYTVPVRIHRAGVWLSSCSCTAHPKAASYHVAELFLTVSCSVRPSHSAPPQSFSLSVDQTGFCLICQMA